MGERLKFAFYWAATCGGCDVAILDLAERILEVIEIAEIVFWPIAMDFKYKDLEAIGEGGIDVAFYDGSVRNSEHEHLAKVLRERSKVLIAFGTCACYGGIPGLANISDRDEIFKVVYRETPSTVNPQLTAPTTCIKIDDVTLTLPEFHDFVKPLNRVVDVDYYIPGCPPPIELIWEAIERIRINKLPPKGSVIGPRYSLCEVCKRKRDERIKIKHVRRVYEGRPDPELCFLDQGYICLGPATRAGCAGGEGGRCLNVNMPCRGCTGPPGGIKDQGARMISALASVMDLEIPPEKLKEMFKDPLGTFYRFTLPSSILSRRVIKK
ncbi:MAG: oxidoreductase [Candidatus Bathyarchaeia archaeon]|nr:oxidoreductase [Candidatus Bathyarchaeota archaeon]